MGQLKSIDLPNSGAHDAAAVTETTPSKSRWWFWVLILGVIAISVWYFRGSRPASEAANPAAPGATSRGRGGPGMGNFVVPVVVATAQRGDLHVYFNVLETVTAFSIVTYLNLVDGSL